MVTLHISESEAAGNFAGLMDHVRNGAEIMIESDSETIAILSPPERKHRTISESIAMAKARSEGRGYSAVMDEDFASDMHEIVRERKPADRSAWD